MTDVLVLRAFGRATGTVVDISQGVLRFLGCGASGQRTDASEEAPEPDTQADVSPAAPRQGRYVYGVAATEEAVDLGPMGIDHSSVYTIPVGNLAAILHDCPAQPYQSDDADEVARWVRTHQEVLEEGGRRFLTVIPLRFNTIIEVPGDGCCADEAVKDWLREEYGRLETIADRIARRSEYVVKVLYHPDALVQLVMEGDQGILQMQQEADAASPGLAYMYRQRISGRLKTAVEKLVARTCRGLYGDIAEQVDDVIVEKTSKRNPDRIICLHLSCLVHENQVRSLGETLEAVDGSRGFSVHFSGPWPPYSFVSRISESASSDSPQPPSSDPRRATK